MANKNKYCLNQTSVCVSSCSHLAKDLFKVSLLVDNPLEFPRKAGSCTECCANLASSLKRRIVLRHLLQMG